MHFWPRGWVGHNAAFPDDQGLKPITLLQDGPVFRHSAKVIVPASNLTRKPMATALLIFQEKIRGKYVPVSTPLELEYPYHGRLQ